MRKMYYLYWNFAKGTTAEAQGIAAVAVVSRVISWPAFSKQKVVKKRL